MKYFFICLLFFVNAAHSQSFGEQKFYILDSLDLDGLTESDKRLIDSCLTVFHACKNDTCKSQAINAIVEGSWDNKVWPRYNQWHHDFLQKKLESNNSKSVALFLQHNYAASINNIAYLYSDNGKSIEAIEMYEQCINIQRAIGDSLGVATTLNNIGYVHDNLGNVTLALEYYSNGLKIRQEAKDSAGMSKSLNNIATVYHEQGQVEKALSVYKETLEMELSLNNLWEVSIRFSNIGSLFETIGKKDSALYYYQESLKTYSDLGSLEGEALSLNKIGKIHYEYQDIEKALFFYTKALSLSQESHDKDGEALTLLNIGEAYRAINNLDLAKKNALDGYLISIENGFPRTIGKAANILYKIHKSKGEFMKSLEMYELYITMKDSIENEQNTRASIQQQIRYKYDNKAANDSIIYAEEQKVNLAEMTAQKAENDRQKLEVNAQKEQKIYLFGGLALVALFSVFIFSRFRIAQKQKNIINLQHHQLEDTHKEISDSIQYAKRLQLAILPSRKELQSALGDGFVFFLPKDIVSGDFYWMQKSGASTVFAAADSTGHGVPGAMVSVVCSNALNRAVKEFGLTDPADILNKTRTIVIDTFARSGKDVKDGMDIALCALTGNQLIYAGAHNPLWIVRKNDNVVTEIKAHKQPIGQHMVLTPFVSHTIELKDGDCFYIFSDGFSDQFGGSSGKKYKTVNFKKLLLSIQEKSMEDQKQILQESFNNWKGEIEQIDDVCVIGVRFSDKRVN